MAVLNSQIKKIHCIGIGGIGVSGIANILLQKGYLISGSDLVANSLTKHLAQQGACIYEGHSAENIKDADLIVYSSAVIPTNPEFAEAKKRKIPLVSRGKLLAELMDNSYAIAIAGTHGKTTTTSLLVHLFQSAKLSPSFAIGGVLNNYQMPSCLDESKYFIAEADESDGSFLHLLPKIAVVTNIDVDHLCHYQDDFNHLKECFIQFLNTLGPDGIAILCVDDPIIREIMPRLNCKKITYGFNEDADIRANSFRQIGLETNYLVLGTKNYGGCQIRLNLPGKHNVCNSLAIVAIADSIGIKKEVLLNSFANFPGVGRRFHSHGEISLSDGKALLFDDYGHHPSEIKVTLEAARGAWPNRRLVLAFQPHRYSRMKNLMNDFAEALSQADVLLLLDVYSAGEQAIQGADGKALLEAVSAKGKIQPIFVPDISQLPLMLKSILRDNDVVLLQGAGNIGPMASQLFLD